MTLLALILGGLSWLLGPTADEPLASATRGITGHGRVETDGGLLRGRPDLDLESPMLVRLAAYESLGDGRFACELEYIGTDVGLFDLREVLVLESGGDVMALEPIPVEVVSNLATDAPTDLVLAEPPDTAIEGGYTTLLVVVGVLWLLVPMVFMARKLVRHAPPEVVVPREPTLAERIAPLVCAAAERKLTIAEQGRLELMLYAHWQAELSLDADDRAAAVARLREDEVGGRLLRAVERWLHDPSVPEPGRDEINELLEPYRDVPAEEPA